MNCFVETHLAAFVITPSLVLLAGDCGTPGCDAHHYRLTLSWLCWTVGLQVEL